MRNEHRIGKRAGFSLIELLVIVTVLGVILVAAIPGIAKWLPRYRVERVTENFVQCVRVARLGSANLHCNHIIRFWTDEARTSQATGPTDQIVAFDILVDRNNNLTVDLPPGGDDRIIRYPRLYKDVVMLLSPTDSGTVLKDPYTFASFPNVMPSPVVFRSDGRAYRVDVGELKEIQTVAYMVKSLTLGGSPPSLSDPIATFKWRWVEIDPLGGVRTRGKAGDDTGR